jgi:hypothetical protein
MMMLVYVDLMRIKFICVLGLMLTEIRDGFLRILCDDAELVFLEFGFGLLLVVDV